MIDSAQLVDSDMNISFVRLVWKYVCVVMVAREMAFVAGRNRIHRLQINGMNTGHRRMSGAEYLFYVANIIRHFCRACGLSVHRATVRQQYSRQLSDKITACYVNINSCGVK
jgi:hypothetical protein